MRLKKEITKIAKSAKQAAIMLGSVSTAQKNRALSSMAAAIIAHKKYILRENQKDIKAAINKKLSSAFIDRLRLNDKRIKEMAHSLKALIKLEDPVGKTISKWRHKGLLIEKVRVPIGVVGIIYESRPNVTSDCAGLCLKSGNAVILRGGSDALKSNLAIFKVIKKAALKNKIPDASLNIIKAKSRKAIDILLGLNDYLDLIIPRGGKGLIKLVAQKSKIPVIKHYEGICHIYVDAKSDLDIAERVCFNAKVQRPGTCNAMETLLVDEKIAKAFLPGFIKHLKEVGVEIRGCSRTKRIIKNIKHATKHDWETEHLNLTLSVKIMKNLDEAIEHINRYGSRHSDAIITKDRKRALRFLKEVDSAAVFVNASTRLHDGFQLGLGAEMGISTDKIHCRGPMGLNELTIYKYVVIGKGKIRK